MSQEFGNNGPEYYDEYEIDLREYIILLWNNKLFIGAIVVLAVIAAFVISSFVLSPQYETKTRIQLSNYDGLYSEPDTAVQLLSSTGLMKTVMSDLGVEMSASKLNSFINNNLTVNQIGDTSIISITVKNKEPALTLNTAQGIINNFESNSNQYFKNKIENDKQYLADLKADLEEINSDLESNRELIAESRENGNLEAVSLLVQENSSLQSSKRELRKEIEEKESKLLDFYSLKVLDSPYLPEDPVSPNTKLNVAIAAVLGLMLAVFIVFFKEFMKEE
ncbi:G-rich domain on putative tyrosine kinase [Halanaerobium congolense]|jgi:capsular polysaccharide biosynthesis protein|uniref:G-rich domain on putative tyrosine kinase n=1 Tax=Halanaerobium congolense TaxID=54121 RepID=A0A1G6IQR1_9FIRM|nr:Wzz/FepE/Etk N-terminal domain-containing protein [Halanaerobium congolense]PTX15900.1 putative tyrosine kinase-like protein [Halanaerobium congolense]SDC08771.1 G-rich domain on putative tyrosine kinase [Halanaerobium congolense]SDF38839.1 G-rich domain on putative tyrosine kinase [Halanaerobium congolense]SES91361.1 G-rich domain on putative tyrosine kinase [Halanaerobium congolense]SFP22121.1 G-rich domain on putative tyrosine kinase [Halanaerobium congolense]